MLPLTFEQLVYTHPVLVHPLSAFIIKAFYPKDGWRSTPQKNDVRIDDREHKNPFNHTPTAPADGLYTLKYTVKRFRIERRGTQVAVTDYGGNGSPALLLHGLYGGAHEWPKVAARLKDSFHVIALDQRGHSENARGISDFTIDAFVDDGAAIECHATSGSTSPSSDWLSRWPLPFTDLSAARRFFRSQQMDDEVWIQVLAKGRDGYRPKFRVEDMRAIAAHLSSYDYRAECASISVPTLVVAGGRSWLDGEQVREVANLIPGSRFIQIEEAGHDVHLDAPEALSAAVVKFLDG